MKCQNSFILVSSIGDYFVGFGYDSNEVLLDQFKCYLSDADIVKVEWPLLHTGIFELQVNL